jgi:hypothetical protein
MDADAQLEQPVILNGLLLTKIHHAARPPETSRRENEKALTQNEINGLPTNPLNILSNLLAITSDNTR